MFKIALKDKQTKVTVHQPHQRREKRNRERLSDWGNRPHIWNSTEKVSNKKKTGTWQEKMQRKLLRRDTLPVKTTHEVVIHSNSIF